MNPRSSESVLVIGDGPTGQSAALLLAKSGFDVHVFGANETPVHKAMLLNYLGFDDLQGPAFVAQAREHARRYGAHLHQTRVESIEPVGEGFRVATSGGAFEGRHLVLATGFAPGVLQQIELERNADGGIHVDHNGRTSRERVYAGGAAVRGRKSQVATSVGDGAAIAIDILSEKRGEAAHDWDVLKVAPQTA